MSRSESEYQRQRSTKGRKRKTDKKKFNDYLRNVVAIQLQNVIAEKYSLEGIIINNLRVSHFVEKNGGKETSPFPSYNVLDRIYAHKNIFVQNIVIEFYSQYMCALFKKELKQDGGFDNKLIMDWDSNKEIRVKNENIEAFFNYFNLKPSTLEKMAEQAEKYQPNSYRYRHGSEGSIYRIKPLDTNTDRTKLLSKSAQESQRLQQAGSRYNAVADNKPKEGNETYQDNTQIKPTCCVVL